MPPPRFLKKWPEHTRDTHVFVEAPPKKGASFRCGNGYYILLFLFGIFWPSRCTTPGGNGKEMRYGLDDRPKLGPLMLYGLQWWVVLLPCVVIMGVVVARMHHADAAAQALYMRKLFALMGVATIAQVFVGHRLPLVVGPASTLLVGITAAVSVSAEAVYTAILAGGFCLAVAAYSGLLTRLRFFFTPRIIAVILILIAFTLTPTILHLVFSGSGRPLFHLSFAVLMVFALVLCNTLLPGVWKSLTVIFGVAGGALVYFLVMGLPPPPAWEQGAPQPFLLTGLELHAGTLVSFLFCFLALTINELGSIEAIGHLLEVPDMDKRIRDGSGMQGLANMAAGGLGVIGPVDFSLSAGIIAATGCASRYTLVPAGAGLIACALSPQLVALLARIPSPVMGALMLYLMASQLSSGLTMLVRERGVTDFNSGIIVGLPLMIGLVIAFAPAAVIDALPDMLRSIAGNGFVMGTIAVIVLEHVVFRKT